MPGTLAGPTLITYEGSALPTSELLLAYVCHVSCRIFYDSSESSGVQGVYNPQWTCHVR